MVEKDDRMEEILTRQSKEFREKYKIRLKEKLEKQSAEFKNYHQQQMDIFIQEMEI